MTQSSSLTWCLRCSMSTPEVEFWLSTPRRKGRSRRLKRRRSRIKIYKRGKTTKFRSSRTKSSMIRRKTRTRRKRSRISRDNSTSWERSLCLWTMRWSTSMCTSSATRNSSRRILSWSKPAPLSSRGSSTKRSNHGSSSKFQLWQRCLSFRPKTKRTTTWWEASTRRWPSLRSKGNWTILPLSLTMWSTRLRPSSTSYLRRTRCLELKCFLGSHQERSRTRFCQTMKGEFKARKPQMPHTRRNSKRITRQRMMGL